MDISGILNDSIEYAKEAVWGKWAKWLLLLVCTIIFPLIMGYELEVYRGKKPAPEIQNWGKLFIDGLKLLVIQLIYAIPVFIVIFIFGAAGVAALASGSPTAFWAAAGSFLAGFLLMLIIAIVIGLIEMIGVVRFAREGSMGEAFNFGAIFGTIGKIGWLDYIFALIVLFLVVGIISFILTLIPFIGVVLLILILPPIILFTARYVTLVYDSATPAAVPAAA